MSSLYHPEGAGQSERGIRGVKQIMKCLLQVKGILIDSWPSLLPQVGYILNSIPNVSTGFTPYRIIFGVDPKPLSLAALDVVTTQSESGLKMEMGKCVVEEVEENLEIAREKMKRAYDSGKSDSGISIGDLVLLKKRNRKSGFDQHFKGPYPVLKRAGPKVLINQEAKGRKTKKWLHLNQCRRFVPYPCQFSIRPINRQRNR